MAYKIDDFELDLTRGCLLRDGEEIHLRPKTFQVAAFLIANRDRLVTKEELMEACWKDTSVSDDVLSQAIAELRRAMGDNPREPVYLKTLPRRGFRFIGPVEEIQPAVLTFRQEVTEVQVREEVITTETPTTKPWALIAAVVLLIALAAGVWWYLHPGMPPPSGGKRQVAVFRFTNQTGQTDLDWMRDGLPDMLTTTLSRSQTLDVLSREQLAVWLGRIGDQGLEGAIELARRSQAQVAILGSFAQTGSRIRVEAQVYDGGSGRLLGADSLIADRPEEILTRVDQLATRLAGRLMTQLPGPALEETMTANLEAYRAYSLGLQQADAFHTQAALDLFKQAVALDPAFVMADARIGFTYAFSEGRIDEARPYLERAFRTGHLNERSRRQVVAWYAVANQDYREAIQRYRELIAAYPREMESYARLAQLLRGESLHEEALEVARQGLAIDADDARLWNLLAAANSELGRHAEAIEAARRYVNLAPGEANAHDSLALAHHFAGDQDRALEALAEALRLNPRFEIALVHRQSALAAAGRYREAMGVTHPLTPDQSSPRITEQAAWFYWRMGKDREARSIIQSIDPKLVRWNPALLLVPGAAAEMHRVTIPGRGGRWGARYQFFYLAQEARYARRHEEMLSTLRELVRHRPAWGSPEIMEDALGDGLLETGHVAEAILEYRRALQLYPGVALAHFHLGQALLRSGDRTGASGAFGKFLELWKNADPELPQLTEARRALSP